MRREGEQFHNKIVLDLFVFYLDLIYFIESKVYTKYFFVLVILWQREAKKSCLKSRSKYTVTNRTKTR